MQACEVWPHGQRPPGYNEAVLSNVPALLISAYLDRATGPTGAAETARYLPNSSHIIVGDGSYAYAGLSPCVDSMTEFIRKGSAFGLN